ncbi:MAG: DUF2183 domain-containing protein [Hymenobacteraceae bacterium]|nr:DUF2183 domain-containing protein [Hymenobacteraceae bacterium]MDX5397828.1 DUF2183 domain-containing protein [Hymenobacteraceae bacterium]MDX5443970.1 DUF2183 domain-containing protein [Hymenobacteraceae bacterium]MDX5513905.1 DUF2183 domain-containing protein [Hymenobacteraceae bacterium]
MKKLKKILAKAAVKAEDKIDFHLFEFRKKYDLFKPLCIQTYRSYGTPERLYVKGRVLTNKGITKSQEDDNLWNNLLNMYRRFASDEIPNAQLGLTFQGVEHTVVTDDEGYFVLNLAPETPLQLDDIWHYIEVNLLDAPVNFEEGIKAKAQVLVPPADAEYGVISDIDDTIVYTSATNRLRMARHVFTNNAHTRLPFPGVSAFYKSLMLGRNGKRNNPFFYVSSSPWNMYDLLHDFLDLHDIPAGPLLLRDFGMSENKFLQSSHMSHKYHEIENILITYPHLKFVLIGDSGQEDAKIYREVVKNHPTRILAIYIRDVKLPERAKMVVDISEELKGHKVEMLLVESTIEAAEHAAANGLVFTEAIPEVAAEKNKEEQLEK